MIRPQKNPPRLRRILVCSGNTAADAYREYASAAEGATNLKNNAMEGSFLPMIFFIEVMRNIPFATDKLKQR